MDRSCAFDVLENHKHIDISAESSVIVFIPNITKPGYQFDAFSEIEKMISHSNLPIIYTNLNDNRFDKLIMKDINASGKEKIVKIPIIKIPFIEGNLSHSLNLIVIG